jgi:hypothetical protein
MKKLEYLKIDGMFTDISKEPRTSKGYYIVSGFVGKEKVLLMTDYWDGNKWDNITREVCYINIPPSHIERD